MNIRIEQMKPVLGNTEQNLLKMLESIEKGIEAGDDIIVFPELALNGYMLEDTVFETAMKKVPDVLLEKSKEISIILAWQKWEKMNIHITQPIILKMEKLYINIEKYIFLIMECFLREDILELERK